MKPLEKSMLRFKNLERKEGIVSVEENWKESRCEMREEPMKTMRATVP
jgi:hypothetical protein